MNTQDMKKDAFEEKLFDTFDRFSFNFVFFQIERKIRLRIYLIENWIDLEQA